MKRLWNDLAKTIKMPNEMYERILKKIINNLQEEELRNENKRKKG